MAKELHYLGIGDCFVMDYITNGGELVTLAYMYGTPEKWLRINVLEVTNQ